MGASKIERQKRTLQVKRPSAHSGGGAAWSGVSANAIANAISTAADHGGAIRFGYTRDGGAFAIGIYGLGDPYTEYLRPDDDVEGFLAQVQEAFADLPVRA